MVEAAELGLFVEALSSYRNTDDFTLEAMLVDLDKSSDAVVYTWSCTPVEGGLCFTGTSLPEDNGNKYSVQADSLAIGTYDFMVSATKGDRKAQTEVQVTIIDGVDYPPTGYVKVVCSGEACKLGKPALEAESLRLEVRQ